MMSPNVYELSSQLKARDPNGNYVVDNAKLTNYLQNPGEIPAPSYLILSEIERRQAEDKQREMYRAMQQGAQPSIKDQAIAANQPAPVVPPHLMAAANPAPMSPEERASSGIAQLAGGGVVALKEGGITGYAVGDLVKRNLFGGFSLGDMYAEPEGSNYRFNEKIRALKELEELKKIRNDDTTFPSILQTDPRTAAAIEARIKQLEVKEAGPGGYDPVARTVEEQKMKKGLEDSLAYETEAQKLDKTIGDTSKKTSLADQEEDALRKAEKDRISELTKLEADRKAIDEDYKNMMLPEDYADQRVNALKDRMGEDVYSKLAQEEKDYLAKEIGGREKEMFGMAALRAGAKMLQSDSPYFAKGLGAGLEEGVGFLATEKRDLDKLKRDSRAIDRDLAKAQRTEDLTISKYGEESEQARLANNRTVGLQQKKDALTARQLEIEADYKNRVGKYYEAGARGMTNAETTRGQKLLEAVPKIMGENNYNKLTLLEAEVSKYDLTDPNKLSKEQARRYNEYLNLKGLYDNALKKAEAYIGPSLTGGSIGSDKMSNPDLYKGFSATLLKP